MKFLVLHFVEPIAAHVHAVAFAAEVVHQFLGTLHKPRFYGTEGEEFVAGLETIVLGGIESFPKTQRVAETLHDELATLDFTFGVLSPQSDVRVPIVVVEDFGIGEIVLKMQIIIQFAQGDDGIAVGIVECVVKVDEEVGIAH